MKRPHIFVFFFSAMASCVLTYNDCQIKWAYVAKLNRFMVFVYFHASQMQYYI